MDRPGHVLLRVDPLQSEDILGSDSRLRVPARHGPQEVMDSAHPDALWVHPDIQCE